MCAHCLPSAKAGPVFLFCTLLLACLGLAQPARAVTALEVHLAAAISPAQADMLDDALAFARHRNVEAPGLPLAAEQRIDVVLLTLDTPGGSIEVMRRMVTSILNSPIPVVVYVWPSGARAASAGVFLTAAASVSAMAPQTTIGAASPIGPGGGDLSKTVDKKIRNDLESLVRGLADKYGRNVNWYKQAIDSAVSLTATEAAADRVVDYLAVDRTDLLVQIGKRGLPTAEGKLRFDGSQVRFVTYEPGVIYRLLSWIFDPQVAYILLLIGVAGVFFELTTPGAILPGVLGGLCLITSLYALSVLPTNAAGLLLLLLAGGLFLLELHVTSYGLLSIAAVIALFLGSMLLFRAEGQTSLPLSLILPTVGGVSAILLGAVWILARAQRQKPRSGMEALLGQTAQVRHFEGRVGKVFVRGEIWDARLIDPTDSVVLAPGQDVVIDGVESFTLLVSAAAKPPVS